MTGRLLSVVLCGCLTFMTACGPEGEDALELNVGDIDESTLTRVVAVPLVVASADGSLETLCRAGTFACVVGNSLGCCDGSTPLPCGAASDCAPGQVCAHGTGFMANQCLTLPAGAAVQER